MTQENKALPEGGEKQEPKGSTAVGAEAENLEGGIAGGEEAPKTHTQVEIDALISAQKSEWDVKRQEHEIGHKAELEKIRSEHEATLAQLQERDTATFLKQVEEAGGDVDMAKRLAGMQTDISKRERTIQQQQVTVDATLKYIDANRLSTQYGVDMTELLKANNPVEMENIALKLHNIKLKTESDEAKKAPQKIDSGTSSGAGEGWRDKSPDEKIRHALTQK